MLLVPFKHVHLNKSSPQIKSDSGTNLIPLSKPLSERDELRHDKIKGSGNFNSDPEFINPKSVL